MPRSNCHAEVCAECGDKIPFYTGSTRLRCLILCDHCRHPVPPSVSGGIRVPLWEETVSNRDPNGPKMLGRRKLY
jgi:hypothetical protein